MYLDTIWSLFLYSLFHFLTYAISYCRPKISSSLQSPKGDKPSTPTGLPFTAIQWYKIQNTTRRGGGEGGTERRIGKTHWPTHLANVWISALTGPRHTCIRSVSAASSRTGSWWAGGRGGRAAPPASRWGYGRSGRCWPAHPVGGPHRTPPAPTDSKMHSFI